MPEPRDPARVRSALGDDLRSLLEEHERLRADIERLLGEKEHLLEEKERNGARKQEGEKKQEDGKQEGEKKEDEKEKPKPPFKERARNWTREHPVGVMLIIATVAILAVATILLLRYLGSYVSTDDAQIDGHTDQVASRVAGTVIAVYVEDNRSVVKGQVLADLDPRDYLTAVAQAEASLAQATAELEAQAPNVPITQTTQSTNVSTAQLEVTNADAALQAAQQSYQSALAEWKQAEANAQNAVTEERRYRDLADKQEVSREQYDQRSTAARAQEQLVASRRAAADAAGGVVKQREAALAQARERYREAQSNQPRQIAVQHATLNTRRANVEAAKAQLEQARLNLSYCKIVAPAAGIVGSKTVEVGEQVAPGQELLAITPTDDIWITANFKETQIVDMHPGQHVTVHVDALGLDFDAYVQNMAGATGAKYSLLPPENATGNYVKVVQRLPIRIRLKTGQREMDRLRPGMSVEPKVWVK